MSDSLQPAAPEKSSEPTKLLASVFSNRTTVTKPPGPDGPSKSIWTVTGARCPRGC